MKKRLMALLLALCLCLPICACAGPDQPSKDPNGSDPSVPENPEDPSNPEDPEDPSDPENPEDPTGPEPEVPEEPETIEGYEVVSREEINLFREDTVRQFGRITYTTSQKNRYLTLDNAGTAFEVLFYGTELVADLVVKDPVYCTVFIDGGEGERYAAKSSRKHTIAKDLEEGVHTLRLVKATSSQNSNLIVRTLKTDGQFLRPKAETKKRIEFIGDSITVGAGVLTTPEEECADKNTDATRSYAYLTAQALGYECSLVATEGICTKAAPFALQFSMMEMYGQISSTNKTPYDFAAAQDVIVVALGTNDGYYLSSHADYAESFAADYAEFLTLVRSKNGNVPIVCVYGMMGTNKTIEAGIQEAIRTLGDDMISYCPLPSGQHGGGSHPSLEDAAKQSQTLTEYLKDLLG